MIIVVCPECKGVGKVDVFLYKNHSEGLVYNTKTCPLCNGIRVVYEKIKVEHIPIENHEHDLS